MSLEEKADKKFEDEWSNFGEIPIGSFPEQPKISAQERLNLFRELLEQKQKQILMSDDSDVTTKGAFFESLNRNNKSIKKDRAIAIAEDAQMRYKRELEDMELELRKLRRERTALLDLSPTDANSLMLANDFDAKGFVNRDIDIGVRLRNLEIRIDIARKSYTELFGE